MSVTQDTAVRMVEITQRKANELFDELIAELRTSGFEFETADSDANVAADGEPAAHLTGYDEPWSFDKVMLADGDWLPMRSVDGETYGWPDSSVDTYHPYDTYTGTGLRTGITLGLGYKNDGVVVGFIVSPGGSKRGLTVFFPTDDFEKSNEKISMIRGGGVRGRAGFGVGAALPAAYNGYKVEMLRDRYAGKWNVQAVVADADDFQTMLNHTALQAKLRKLIL